MKSTLTTLMMSVLVSAAVAGEQVSDSIQSFQVIEINPAAFPSADTRGVQVRYNNREPADVVATQNSDGNISWSGSQREAMGGQDAPARILVRAFDGVFSIDPFVPISGASEDLANVLFNGTTLETNRALFNRQGIERVETLMEILEVARQNWLQNNGFYGVKAFTSSKASDGQDQASATLPKPSATFRRPADAPRGKSREQVNNSTSKARSIASSLLSGDEPIRISLPMGTNPDVVARVEARNSQSEQESQELASND